MTELAPAARALVMSPENLMPPSEITGILLFEASCEHSKTAVICGMPIPVTTRVVQIDPPPMPTFTASAPAVIRSLVASAVATLPAISWISGYSFLIASVVLSTLIWWP